MRAPKPHPVLLDLGSALPSQKKHWRLNLSAVAIDGDRLFLADDEHPSICVLHRIAADRWKAVDVIRVADAVPDLPGGADGETDIEGMDFRDGRLWLVGSHSLARRQPKRKDRPDERLRKLREIRTDPNRHLLGSIDPDKRCGAVLPMCAGEGRLHDYVARDPYLAPFLTIPAKENGFDVEGLAVAPGRRVFLGLRGPVLRGWAVVLDLDLDLDGTRNGRLDIVTPQDGYRRHFLDLGGLGVRDLLRDGQDLLILAGPTMDIDGPVRVLRWRDALDASADSAVPADELEAVLEVPFGRSCDHAEAIERVDRDMLMVIYDSPAAERLQEGDTTVLADLFEIGH